MSLPADLSRPIARTSLRIRLQRAMNAGAMLTVAGLGVAGLVIALMKMGELGEARALPWLWVAGALPVIGIIVGAARPLSRLLPPQLLDRAHGLHDRVTNAVSFAAMSERERTRFMDAAIEDARAHASGLSAKRAMPLKVPFDVVPAFGLGVGVAFLAMLEVPHIVEEHVAATTSIVPVVLHQDDLAAFDSNLRDLIEDPETPEDVRSAAREFNRLVEDLADQRLDRAETLRRIAELEQRLENARPADAALLNDALQQLGRDLTHAPLSEELSQALADADAQRAEAEMRRLAERLRNEHPNRGELDRLRRALQRAADNRPEDRSEEIREREEEIQRLLQRQREQNRQESEQERRLLQRRQRDLDRLRRESQEQQERQRQLDRLQRELEQAAQQLGQDQQDQAAQDLDQGAPDLNRMAREQMSNEEMQRLQQQLQQLRELIRRQQQSGGQGQRQQQGQGQSRGQGQGQSQMDRFVLRARGQGDGQGTPLGMPGQGGQQGQAQQGQDGQGQGQNGQGQEQQQMLTLGGDGQGNAVLEMPGMGQGQGQGQQGQGPARMGPGAGTGHDATTLDDPTRLGGNHQTVRVEGQQQAGPSRSEVILSSAERGFASRDYQDVYTDYSDHAEDVLERDEIPPGYRFYVRRYFQLIRPREAE